ncbi:MAG: hypothetical protein AAB588_04350 [Patescibacteria group bacterium]
MNFEKYSPLTRMILGSLIGIVFGIFAGFIFAIIIEWISTQMCTATNPTPCVGNDYDDSLGMGLGAVIAGVLGAIYANKK